MNTLHEIMSRDMDSTAMSRETTSRDSTMLDVPSSAFKFRSGMPLDMPSGGYRHGDYEEDDTITKRRRIGSNLSSGKAKNVTWEEDSRGGLHEMLEQLVMQNQRMEEKLGRLERVEEKMERMERMEGRLMRLESKMDEILRLCR
ncbi:hypothetical protein CJU89_3523 [Yarrowia sp. B02]|nr:hypothetical protein CJU89_3523 [Yarrowia sp. B02]